MAAQKKKPDVIVEDGVVFVSRSGTPVYMKTADICAMTGKSNQWIGQLTSQGTLAKKSTSHGSMYELGPTMRTYCDYLNERVQAKQDKDVAAAKTEKEKLESEASIKKAKAIMAVLQAKEMQGKMHRSEDVAAMTEDLIFTIRGMLLALPGRLAVDAAQLSDSAEVSELIRSEVYAIMEELSQYKYDAKKYEERVRERMSWENIALGDVADESG